MKKVLFGEQKFSNFSIGFVELNYGPALNALDTQMLADIEKKLKAWEINPEMALVVFHSEHPKAFCAGGDVKTLAVKTRDEGIQVAENFFTQEYFTDYLVHRYKKPVLAWLDGITMGGGIGLTQGASHKVVTDRTVLSMPEVFIGLFPDVGGSGFLTQLKNGFGYFAGLAGARLSGRLGYEMGWQNFFLRHDKKRKVLADILRMEWSESPEKNKEILSHYLNSMMTIEREVSTHSLSEYSETDQKLLLHWKAIETEFQNALTARDFAKMVQLVKSTEGTDGRHRSLLSQALFFELALAAELDLASGSLQAWQKILAREWVVSVEMSRGPHFYEGVRAVLLDKDQKPAWPNWTHEQALAEAGKIISSPIENHLQRRFKAEF